MRTSLTEIKHIEDWLWKRGDVQERLVFEGRMLTSPKIRENVNAQLLVHQLIRLTGREKLKGEIRKVEYQLFNNPRHRTFQERIHSIFRQ